MLVLGIYFADKHPDGLFYILLITVEQWEWFSFHFGHSLNIERWPELVIP